MRLTGKDAVATLATAAAAIVYVIWVTGTAMADTSVRVVAGIVFALGWVGCTSTGARMAAVYGAGQERRAPMAYVVLASLVGAVALIAGIIAILGASELWLAVLFAAMVVLWVMTTIRHATSDETAEVIEHRAHPGMPRAA